MHPLLTRISIDPSICFGKAMMVTPDHPEYAHPIFWAPFVVVGEGDAGTSNNSSPIGNALKHFDDLLQRARQ